MKSHRWLAFLLLARLLLGCAYSVAIPAGEAPDEADHLAYAAYIAREHRLPVGADVTQAKHPPLYHVLAAVVAGPAGLDTGFLRANPDIGFTADASPNFFIHTTVESWPWRDGPLAMRLARLLSVCAGVGLVAATYMLGCAVWPVRRGLAMAAATFVAFLPESLFVGGAMNNDTLAALLGTTALWLALRSDKPWHAAVTGLIMGLGLWAKVSVAALWPAVCLAMVARRWEGRRTQDAGPSPAAKLATRAGTQVANFAAVIAGGVALAVTAPWFLRNRQLYGDWLGWPLVLATIDRRTGPFGPAELAWLLRGLFLSFWGKFGGAGHIALPWPFYVLWTGLVAASAAGWLKQIGKSASRQVGEVSFVFRLWSFVLRPSSIVLLAAPLLTFAWLVAYSRTALGTDQGRLLFPAIGPLALLLVGGLAGLRIADLRLPIADFKLRIGLGAWYGILLLIASLALIFGLWLPFAPPPAPSAAEVAAAQPVGRTFGDGVELVSYRWEAAGGQSDTREVVLFWRAIRPITADLRTALRLVDAQGNVLWEWKRSPGAGRFSTDRWPVGRLVADVYRVPAGPFAGAARVEVGVRPFPEGAWLNVDGAPQTPFVRIEQPAP